MEKYKDYSPKTMIILAILLFFLCWFFMGGEILPGFCMFVVVFSIFTIMDLCILVGKYVAKKEKKDD